MAKVTIMSLNISEILNRLHINDINEAFSTGNQWGSSSNAVIKDIVSPVDGKKIASVKIADAANYNQVVEQAAKAFITWRTIPAPKRGEIVREIGDALRENKEELGKLVSYEMGKSLQEGYGEVQEMIDICDFAVGLSRAVVWLNHAQ